MYRQNRNRVRVSNRKTNNAEAAIVVAPRSEKTAVSHCALLLQKLPQDTVHVCLNGNAAMSENRNSLLLCICLLLTVLPFILLALDGRNEYNVFS